MKDVLIRRLLLPAVALLLAAVQVEATAAQ
jgi:hypothetical protein